MKSFILVFVLIITLSCQSNISSAQFINIPDSNFVTWLNNNGFSSCMNGAWMDTTCPAILNATKVNCGFSNISSLVGITYFDNLDTLICFYNTLITLPALPPSLLYLDCSHNSLTSLPALPPTLLLIKCEFNQLNILPTLPLQLEYLACGSNQLTILPSLPSTLYYLSCYKNQLTFIPSIPALSYFYTQQNPLTSLPPLSNGMINLYCGLSNLTSLPTLPTTLSNLDCQSSQLTSLPALPSNLTSLHCENNMITSLPTLPPNITQLIFSGNLVTTLPSLPNSIMNLQFSNNQISVVPTLPANLNYLYCAYNMISSLPPFPSGMKEVICNNNQLTTIPELPAGVYRLLCYNNQLTSLGGLSDSLNYLYIFNNPNLLCLPLFKKVNNMNFTNTGIQCLPTYGTVLSSSPLMNSLPLCDMFNANACPAYWNISGKVFNDVNANCVQDGSEISLPELKIQLYSAGTLVQQTYTGGEGRYSFDSGLGTFSYKVDTTGLPVSVSCPVGGIQNSILTTIDSTDINMDFAMKCKAGYDIGVKSIVRDSGLFRPAHFASLRIGAGDMSRSFGLQCANGISGTVKVIISGPVSYINALPGSMVPAISGDTLIYTILNFGTINFNSAFRFIVQTDTTATAGSTVCFDVRVTPVAGDIYSSNNNQTVCYNIVNSFDPNLKEVSPIGNISPTQIWLVYTIHFQNTGTTSAEHVYITDTLSSNLNASTFELLSSSHYNITQVIGNVVRFNFPAINLPDSATSESGSKGYVQFRIKLVPGLNNGTPIFNTANIFFDFNQPVITNTVKNLISSTTGLTLLTDKEYYFDFYPNPVSHHQLTINSNLPSSSSSVFELQDLNGKVVYKKSLTNQPQQLVILPFQISGFYIGSLRSENFMIMRKIIIIP